MAHYAELDVSNTVVQVVVIDNDIEAPANGDPVQEEVLGLAWLANFGPTAGKRFVKTSFNNNIRKNYAGIDHTYDAEVDAFIPRQPFPSWILSATTFQWEPPVPRPGPEYLWDEINNEWVPL